MNYVRMKLTLKFEKRTEIEIVKEKTADCGINRTKVPLKSTRRTRPLYNIVIFRTLVLLLVNTCHTVADFMEILL